MLSTENPPSAGLLSSSETSQLKSGSCNTERASDDGGRQQQQLEEVDLTKYDNSPLPNFSIRDYVFNSRGKDIENHWPFSPKHLKLCFMHGVKDVLPPFDSVTRSSAVEGINNSDVKESCNHHLCVSSNNVSEKLALGIDNVKASGSEDDKDKENPLPLTSYSNSIVNSVPTTKGRPYLKQSLAEKPETLVIPVSKKVESTSQALVKNCRLLVKLSSVAELRPSQELSVNTSMASETMASQVCPVCKTFSSPSNTTLNAHIDQCLSRESTVKWTANPKVVKHNIKPRKTRLMADIYAAALHCTLEDLDRRNGTNWAFNPDIVLVEDTEVCPEEKNRVSSEKSDEGTVYLDSDGRKLRILSKFDDQQSDDDFVPVNLTRTDKGSKHLPMKKKRHLVHRHESPNAREQMKSDNFRKMKEWVGSKRTGLKGKINREHKNQCPDKISKELRSSRYPPSVADNVIMTKCGLNFKRKENLSFTSHDEYIEQPCVKNQDGYSLLALDCHVKKNRLMLSNCNVQSRKDGPSVHKRCSTDHSTIGTEGHTSTWSSKKMRSTSPAGNGDSSFIKSRISLQDTVSSKGGNFQSPKKITSEHANLLGGKKSMSLRKNALSVKHEPHSQLKRLRKKNFNHKKHWMHHVCRSDDETAVSSVPAVHGHAYLVEALMGFKNQKGRAGSMRTSKEGDTVSNGSGMPRSCDSNDVEKKIGTLGAGDASNVPDRVKEVGSLDGFVCEPMSRLSGEEACMTSRDSSDSGSPGLSGLPNLKMDLRDYVKAYQEHYPCDLGERENYCREKVSKGDGASEALGSYFVDVNPISIPGPPGSFLPSPGHIGSEELQGNSSLTTCMILSSEDDEHELVDMDTTSESPVSATSFASNSVAARSDSVPFANIAAPSQGDVQCDYSQCDVSEERMDPAVESCFPFNHAANVNEKVKLEAKMKICEMSPAGTFKNGQPWCCSRKEGVKQNVSLNYHHDWERPRGQRTITFLPEPPSQDHDQIDKLCSSELRPETLSQKECAAVTVSYNPEDKFLTHGDCEYPSPSSSSNSVLRLMGKNLVVVNKEANQYWPPQFMPTQSRTLGPFPIHNASSQGGDMQTCTAVVEYLDFGSSDQGSKLRTPNLYPYHQPSRVLPTSKGFGKGLVPSPQCHRYSDQCHLVPKLRKTDSLSAQPKEIIVRDELLDNDGRLAFIKATGNRMVNNMELADDESSSVHISTSWALGHDSGRVKNPFHNYKTPSFPLHSRSQMVTLSRNAGGSSAVHPNSAPPTGHYSWMRVHSHKLKKHRNILSDHHCVL